MMVGFCEWRPSLRTCSLISFIGMILRVCFSDFSSCFFVEGSILAQDERWRRA